MTQKLPDMRAVTYQQRAETEIRTLLLPAAALLYIEEGSKHVSSANKSLQIASSGEFVFLQPHSEVSVRNTVGPGGHYLAQGLIFDGQSLSDHLPCNRETANEFHCFKAPGEMVEAFTRMRAAVRHADLPEQVRQARFFELKAWLTRLGICLSARPSYTLAQKLNALLASDLAHPWRGTEVAAQFGMSEATLRRGLAREGTNFTEILRESRLQSALERLQTTEQSLSEIAYNTGFSSHSHFTDVFRKRFDFPPSHLRGRGEPQMIGM